MIFDTKEIIIGGTEWKTAPFRFSKMFTLGGESSPSYIDVLLSGVSPLALTNAISLNYVKAFGACKQGSSLPDGYTQNKYTWMKEQSYLLTNITQHSNWHYELEIQTTQILANGMVFLGSRDGSDNSTTFDAGCLAEMLTIFFYGFGVIYRSGVRILANTRYKFVWENNKWNVYQEGTKVATMGFSPSYTTKDVPIAINAINTKNSVSTGSSGSVYFYGFKVWDDTGELKADYIPVTKTQGSVPGVYDRVTDTFMTATSGTWASGPEDQLSPDNPMDIYCNNGVLKARHQSGLPLGYTLLEYLQSTGTQYIDTGIVLKSKATITTVGQFMSISSSNPISMWGFMGNSNMPRWGCSVYNNMWLMDLNFTNAQGTANTNKHTFVNETDGTTTYDSYVDGVALYKQKGLTNPQTYTSNVLSAYIFARNNSNTAGNFSSSRIYSYNIVQDDIEVINLIPARRNSDNVLGMYDTVTCNFLTNQGSDTFTAGNPVSDPVEIYTDGTQETVEIDTTGDTANAEMLLKVGDYKDNQELLTGDVTRNVGIKVFDGTEDWTYNNSAFLMDLIDRLPQKKFMFCTHFNYDGGSSTTIPNLCIGCGSTTNTIFIKYQTYNTLEQFKQYLADQYANGTPVIVVYPLATPTTETVTGQPLTVQQGTNTVTITQASIDDLTLELSYKQSI